MFVPIVWLVFAMWVMPAKRFVLGSGERCTCSKIDNIHKLYACIDNIHVLYTRIAGNGNVNARYSGFYWLSTPNTSMPNSDTGACYYLNFLRAC